MRQLQETLAVITPGRGLIDISSRVADVVRRSGVTTGLCVVFCKHTSCSLAILENASKDAAVDLLAFLARLAPDGDPRHSHADEGPDDMPAHLRSVLTRTSESVPVTDGVLALGRWQGVFLLEHKLRGSARKLVVHVTGD